MLDALNTRDISLKTWKSVESVDGPADNRRGRDATAGASGSTARGPGPERRGVRPPVEAAQALVSVDLLDHVRHAAPRSNRRGDTDRHPHGAGWQARLVCQP